MGSKESVLAQLKTKKRAADVIAISLLILALSYTHYETRKYRHNTQQMLDKRGEWMKEVDAKMADRVYRAEIEKLIEVANDRDIELPSLVELVETQADE